MSREDLRIYARSSPGTGPARPPRVTSILPSAPRKPRSDSAAIIAGEVIRILDAIPVAGESVQRAFDRKEHELRAVIASLTYAEATALHLRLIGNRKDGVNASFARLTAERRARVLSFLAESPRSRAGAL